MVMMSDIPLPMPRSVIWSPIHIRSSVPAVMVITVVNSKPSPCAETRGTPILLMVSMMFCRKGFA